MAENYKHLYHQMKKMVEQYQDVIVPGLREQLEKRAEVVRCRDCVYSHPDLTFAGETDMLCEMWAECSTEEDSFCSYGERFKET